MAVNTAPWLALVALAALSGLGSSGYLPGLREIDRVLTNGNYNKFVPPVTPEYVYIGFHVNNMAFDYQRGTLDINVYMRMLWDDYRLGDIFKGYNVTDRDRVRFFKEHVEKLWIPDIFIKNSDKVERIDGLIPELLMTVNKHGSVWYVPRFVKTVYCPELRAGKRLTTCKVDFESYGYSNSQLRLSWLRSPINMEANMTTDGHVLDGEPSYGNCSDTMGAYPCLSASFTWRRLPPRRVFEIGIYVSSVLLLIISWLGFWTPPGDRRIFLGLGIAVVLAILYMAVTEYQAFAYLEVVTSAQTWLVFAFIMDLAMVLEYAFAHVLIRIIPNTFKALCQCRVPDFKHILFENEDEMKASARNDAGESGEIDPNPKGAMRVGYIIDMVSGVFVFPVLFIIFFVSWAGTYLPFV